MKVAEIDWDAVGARLDAEGCAVVRGLMAGDTCRAYAAAYEDAGRYRNRVVMERHGFGRGEYQYFCYPLPDGLAQLRRELYMPLAGVANRWHEALRMEARFPRDHADFIARCHEAGQRRPTPLILRYREGDYNCLHQDLYGKHVFPLQVAVLLSRPGDVSQVASWC